MHKLRSVPERQVAVVFFLLLNLLFAQENPTVITIPRITTSIEIDGYIQEEAWREAFKIQDMFTYFPVDGQPAPEKTAILFLHNASSLYIAFICFDSSPHLIRASIAKRDDIFDDDHVTLFLDTFNNGKEAYEFDFNPYGIQTDGIYVDMVEQNLKPDFLLYSKGRLFDKGYIVEVEIPFRSLRFPSKPERTWGIALMRTIPHLDKTFIWPAISQYATTFVPQFGKLHGLSGIGTEYNLEMLPEFWSIQQGTINTATHQFIEQPMEYEGGLNLKFGFLSNWTVDLTYNPDFSQIEADADKIDVNRRFPLYYPEKRPFFLEGTNIFQTPFQIPNNPFSVVYTRRIVDPVIGLKLTGQAGGFEIGLLGGVDEYYGSREYLTEVSTGYSYLHPEFDQESFIKKKLNQNSFHNIFRIKKNFGNSSHLGFILTDMRQGDAFSSAFGVDGSFLFGEEYSLSLQAIQSVNRNIFSNSTGNDPAFSASLFRSSQDISFQLSYQDVFPDFEVANGFLMREPDFREGSVSIWYDFYSEKSVFSRIRPMVYLSDMFNHDGDKIESYMAPMITMEMTGRHKMDFRFYRQFEEYAGHSFNKNWYYLEYSNQTFSWISFNISDYFGDGIFYDAVYYEIPPFLGRMHSFSGSMELKLLNNWASELTISIYDFAGTYESVPYNTMQNIYRLRTNFQFSREVGIRVILERNDYYRDLDVNALFSYHPSPGTVIFTGYHDYFFRDPANRYNRYARGFFLKFSYLFRL